MRNLVLAALVGTMFLSHPAAARFGVSMELKLETGKPLKSVAELTRKPPHPVELGAYTVGKPLIAILGSDLDTVSQILGGPGQGRVIGGSYVGTSCMRHACPDADVLIVISLADQKPYVAWRWYGETAVKPVANAWPMDAKQFLEQWRTRALR